MRVQAHALIVFHIKIVSIGCMLMLITSCTTPYTGPDTATYSIDLTITSDPPGADIYSIPGRSHSDGSLNYTDYAYEKYGHGEHWIGRTPYRTTLNCTLKRGPGGTVDELWRTDINNGGGDSIMFLKITQFRQEHALYSDYRHTLDLVYNLKLDGYASEPASITIADGTYTYTDMIKNASSRPVFKHHILKHK